MKKEACWRKDGETPPHGTVLVAIRQHPVVMRDDIIAGYYSERSITPYHGASVPWDEVVAWTTFQELVGTIWDEDLFDESY